MGRPIKVTPIMSAPQKVTGWQVYYYNPGKDAKIRRVNARVAGGDQAAALHLAQVCATYIGTRVELLDLTDPPGGWVCGEANPDQPDGYCGMPVESVPCTVHHPGLES